MGQTKKNIRNWFNKAAAPYLCDQYEGDLYDAYLELKDVQDNGHDWHIADEYVQVWEPLAHKTVREIIELIEAGVEEDADTKFFKTIDWSELRNQKRELLQVIDNMEGSENGSADLLYGILHLIDAMQDYAVDELEIIDGIHVYDFDDEEKRED